MKGNQKLGLEAAQRIRVALSMGYSVASQARLYGVRPHTVEEIRDGLTYKPSPAQPPQREAEQEG